MMLIRSLGTLFCSNTRALDGKMKFQNALTEKFIICCSSLSYKQSVARSNFRMTIMLHLGFQPYWKMTEMSSYPFEFIPEKMYQNLVRFRENLQVSKT